MMMRTCNFSAVKLLISLLLFCFLPNLFSEEVKWVLACDKFSSEATFGFNDKESSVGKALGELIPQQILDNLISGKARVISPEEEFARTSWKMKSDRISLFLQLESAVKTRDALVLQDLSDSALKSKIKNEDKKIQDLRDKISKNLQELEEAEKKSLEKGNSVSEKKESGELAKYLNLFKGLVSTEDQSLSEETVSFYGSGDSHFYKSSSSVEGKEKYTDRDFVKSIQSAGIKGLLTGDIRIMDDFMRVTADLYVYPLGKSVFTVTEVGSVSDADFISRNIANALSPVIASSLPVTVSFEITPKEAADNITFVIDDVVHKDFSNSFILDSGVHSIRFDAPGFRTASTSYFFNGNETYQVSVDMKNITSTKLNIKVPGNITGSFSVNGEPAGEITVEENVSSIVINGEKILGSFVSEDGSQGFFFIPEKLIREDETVTIKPKLFDKADYIDNRRKMMYTSYSVFLCSLLGTVFTYGNYNLTQNAFVASGGKNAKVGQEANIWGISSLAMAGVSIGCGGWFIFELTRYLKAADSVLPVNGK